MIRTLLTMLGLLLAMPLPAAATNLADAAAAMAPGTFVELTGMNNFNNGTILVPTGCSPGSGPDITEFANKAQWNPIAKRFQFVGISHQPCGGTNARAIFYDDATNTWGDLPNPMVGQNDPRHTYDQNAIDPATGTHYVTNYNSITTYILPNGAGSWSSTNRIDTGTQCCTADAFFPTFQGGGRLFHWDGSRGLYSYNPSNGQWQWNATTVGFGGLPGGLALIGGETSVFNHYSAACDCILFGGGSVGGAPLYKMSTTGAVTQMSLSNAPSGFHVAPQGTSLVVDPVTGFLITINNGGMKQFDPRVGSGTWTNVSVTLPSFFMNGDAADKLISGPIPPYGVIMYVKINIAAGSPGSTRVFLYKHRPSQPGPGPSTPINVTTQ